MAETSALKFGRTSNGYRLRVEGRGTMRESRPAEEFVSFAIQKEKGAVVVDLSACTYLDSTFLGCLASLKKRYGLSSSPLFEVAAPPDVSARLFGPTNLDALLRSIPQAPAVVGAEVSLPPSAMSSPDMSRHIMECHRQLAELGGPLQKAFAAIADQIERELQKAP